MAPLELPVLPTLDEVPVADEAASPKPVGMSLPMA
jgi:hypothetical protein